MRAATSAEDEGYRDNSRRRCRGQGLGSHLWVESATEAFRMGVNCWERQYATGRRHRVLTIECGQVVDEVPTYRGEWHAFV